MEILYFKESLKYLVNLARTHFIYLFTLLFSLKLYGYIIAITFELRKTNLKILDFYCHKTKQDIT